MASLVVKFDRSNISRWGFPKFDEGCRNKICPIIGTYVDGED